jgi:hypothetical protein
VDPRLYVFWIHFDWWFPVLCLGGGICTKVGTCTYHENFWLGMVIIFLDWGSHWIKVVVPSQLWTYYQHICDRVQASVSAVHFGQIPPNSPIISKNGQVSNHLHLVLALYWVVGNLAGFWIRPGFLLISLAIHWHTHVYLYHFNSCRNIAEKLKTINLEYSTVSSPELGNLLEHALARVISDHIIFTLIRSITIDHGRCIYF